MLCSNVLLATGVGLAVKGKDRSNPARGQGNREAMIHFDSQGDPRPRLAAAWTIALDGGTTNTRARLLHGSRLIATARRAVGVRDTVLDEPGTSPSSSGRARRESLVEAVRAVIDEVRGAAVSGVELEVVAAGMLSSEVGLVAVPHVDSPAGLDELAHAAAVVSLPEVHDQPILVVPGIRTSATKGPEGWFESDVMRGEECETLGAHATLVADGRIAAREPVLFLWPGSHTKLVAVDADGRITQSFTTLAGEILQAVARHTLLAASLPAAWPDDLDPEAAAAGARAAERFGLGRAAFLVRIAALSKVLDAGRRAAFWIGAAVAADVMDLAGHPLLESRRAIWVGSRQPLRSLYVASLARRHAGPVVEIDDSLAEASSALGACAVAARRRFFEGV